MPYLTRRSLEKGVPGEMVPTLVISGPVGVGKTRVAAEVGNLLEARNISHAVIDLDELDWFPRPEQYFGAQVARLGRLWDDLRDAGCANLVLAGVVESTDEVGAIQRVVLAEPLVVCRLRAAVEILRGRLRQREAGPDLVWHVDRAVELAESLDGTGPGDVIIDTDHRSIREVAQEVVGLIDWRS